MEGQDDLNSNDWSWFDQLVSGPLAGTPVAQPEAPMDFGERTGVFANGSPPEGQVASDLSFATLGSDCALPPYTMHFTDDVDAMFNGAFEGSSLSANNNATSGEAVIAGLPPRPDGSPAIVVPLEQRMKVFEQRLENIERRFDNVEHNDRLLYGQNDATQKAMKRWSITVNKTLLEIAKAVGIPLYYKDTVAGVAPSYGAGAFIRYTTGDKTSNEHAADHAHGGDSPGHDA